MFLAQLPKSQLSVISESSIMDCGGKFLKFLVFFFNAIVFIGGGIMAGYGIFLLVEAKQAAGSVSIVLPAFITTFGLLLFMIGFLGCFGACYNNSCMLKTFAAIVGFLLVCEVVCAIILLVYRHDFVDLVGKELQKTINSIENNELNSNDDLVENLYKVQKELECCGGTGPSDWKKIPPSCYGKENKNSTLYKTGCAQAMYEKAKDSALIFSIIIIVIALIQIGAIICAVCLAKKVNEYEKIGRDLEVDSDSFTEMTNYQTCGMQKIKTLLFSNHIRLLKVTGD
ncbi:hypothetical protein ACTXT7_007211 [Hymenolepis weldensis]